MVTPVHARVRFVGQLYGDALWSVGFAFGAAGGGDPFGNGTGDVTGALEIWRDNIKALNNGTVLPDTVKNALSSVGTLQQIRCSRIGPDGKESAVALVNILPEVPGAGNGLHSAQTAVVASLSTGRPGASYRGRVYWPAIGYGVANGRLGAPTCAALSQSTAQFLRDIAAAAHGFGGVGGIDPVVVSTAKGVATKVTGVRVGNRLDTQRRRAEAEKELYSVAAVPQ